MKKYIGINVKIILSFVAIITFSTLFSWFIVWQDLQSFERILKEERDSILRSIFLVSLALGLLSIVIVNVIVRRINRPIIEIKDLMKEAEAGNFTVKARIVSNDEAGQLSQSFNNMLEGQKNLFKNIRNLIESINASSKRINESIDELSGASQIQAYSSGNFNFIIDDMNSSIQSINNSISRMTQNIVSSSGSIGNMGSSIQEISEFAKVTAQEEDELNKAILHLEDLIKGITENAKDASKEASNAVTRALEGQEVIGKAVSEIDKINDEVSQIQMKIKEFGEFASNAEDIINLINDIAEQTNLLALNAAIEAARAGEHGRGFAVVADSIRQLSEKTGESTKDISKLIANIQYGADEAISTTGKGTDKIKNGIELVKDAGKMFAEIMRAISKTTDLVQQITVCTSKQYKESKEVSTAVKKIGEYVIGLSKILEEQAVSSDEVVSSINEISLVAQQITNFVDSQSSKSQQIVKISEDVNGGADSVSNTSLIIAAEVDKFSREVDSLNEEISKFKID